MFRWPNFCPFCGSPSCAGGTGSRHTVYHCMTCHTDYMVDYFGAYPANKQLDCDREFLKHGGVLELNAQGEETAGPVASDERGCSSN